MLPALVLRRCGSENHGRGQGNDVLQRWGVRVVSGGGQHWSISNSSSNEYNEMTFPIKNVLIMMMVSFFRCAPSLSSWSQRGSDE